MEGKGGETYRRLRPSAVLSFACSCVRLQTASFKLDCFPLAVLHFGKNRTSSPHIENNNCGLSLEYTLTDVSFHPMVVSERGNDCFAFQNTARPKFTSYLIRRMRHRACCCTR